MSVPPTGDFADPDRRGRSASVVKLLDAPLESTEKLEKLWSRPSPFGQPFTPNRQADNAVTFVTVRDGVVLGYYAVAMSAYAAVDLPERLRKNRPSQTPCLLLARLAVDRSAQRQGVSAALLRDAIERAYSLSRSAGSAALLIHCRDDDARASYLANGDFVQSPLEPLHLILPMKAIRQRLER